MINIAAVNICVQIFMWTSVFISSALIPRSRITGSYGSHVFHFFRAYQAVNGTPLQYSCLENPRTEEPGRLQSMGSLRVRHDWATSLHFSLSCIGEGNGNPLQCSCLENPRDGEAWWAAVYGVAQSWTRLKWLSSSMQVLGIIVIIKSIIILKLSSLSL